MKRISKSAKNADKEILKLHTGRTQKQHSSLIVYAACGGMMERMEDMVNTAKTWFGFRKYLKYIWGEKKRLYLYGILFFPAFIAANYFQVYLPKMVVQELEEGRTIPFLGGSMLVVIAAMLACIILRVTMMSKMEYGNRMLAWKMQNEYILSEIALYFSTLFLFFLSRL